MMTAIPWMSRCCVASLVGAALVALAWQDAGAQELPQGFVLHEVPKPLPEISFRVADGRARSLAAFRGKVVVLNIWATWCPPCVREMPTLDQLQARLGGADFEVVALSIDRAGLDVVRKFFIELGVKHLGVYVDSSGKALRDLGVAGLPTTLLIDRDGRELGRLAGPAEWDAPEMIDFLQNHVDDTSSSLAPAPHEQTLAGPANQRELARKNIHAEPLTFQ